jgi:hypothetical protein
MVLSAFRRWHTWCVLGGAVGGLGLTVALCHWYWARGSPSADYWQAYYTFGMVNRLLMDFNGPPDAGFRPLLRKFSGEHAAFFAPSNSMNRGAEILYAMGAAGLWVSDTDSDGRPEACDEFGNPLILLGPECAGDIVIDRDGHRWDVFAPPCCKSGYYVNSLLFHVWSASQQEAFEAWVAGLAREAAPTSQATRE